jgi:hypothetical protein
MSYNPPGTPIKTSHPDFPYDLNKLFTLTYSFDVLKEAIEYLAKTQAAHGKLLGQLAEDAKRYECKSFNFMI